MLFLLFFAAAAFFMPGVLIKYSFIRTITHASWKDAFRMDLVINLFTTVYLCLLSIPILGYFMFSTPMPASIAPTFLGLSLMAAILDRAALRVFFRGSVKCNHAYWKLLLANLLNGITALMIIRPCVLHG